MKYTQTKIGKEARESIKRGMEQVYQPVAATIGASGRNSCFSDIIPVITNDGVSIARRIKPKDRFERLGADLIKQAAEETNDKAGDGTTTSIVLAYSMVEKGLQELSEGNKNPMVLRRELEEARDEVIDLIKKSSKEIKNDKELLDVAKISVEDEKLAKVVTDAVKESGEFGNVIVEEGNGYDIEKDVVSGYFWDRGYFSPYFMTNSKGEAILEDVHVIVTDRYMNRNLELIGVINEMHEKGAKSFLIIADRMEGELLQTLITNKLKGILNICAVSRPASDAELEDIASITGGTAIIQDKGIRQIRAEHVGFAKKIIVSKEKTLLVSDNTIPAHSERVGALKEELKDIKDEEQKGRVEERLAKLTDGMVRLSVGARTESERTYLRLKLEDAVNAVRSAKQEGVVKGGGVALLDIASKIKNPIMRYSLSRPFFKILENAGIEIEEGTYPSGDGYNVLTGETVEDMFEVGIIDPAKVERCAVENAVSLAGTVLTLESVIVDLVEKESSSVDSGRIQ